MAFFTTMTLCVPVMTSGSDTAVTASELTDSTSTPFCPNYDESLVTLSGSNNRNQVLASSSESRRGEEGACESDGNQNELEGK